MAKKVSIKKDTKLNKAPQSEQNEVVLTMKDLQVSAGWQMIVNNFNANIKYLESQILEKVDAEGVPISEEDVDTLRNKREIMLDLINTPDTFIRLAQQSPEVHYEQFDPYHTDAKESLNADKKEINDLVDSQPLESG
jgi:hypothetical protein